MTKAIIIDDDIQFTNILKKIILKKCQHLQWQLEITTSSRPMDAIDGKNIYDIYFIDISMPELMGIDLAKKLREHHIYREFVFVSAYGRQYMRESIFVRPRAFVRKEHLDTDLDETLAVLKDIFCQPNTAITVKDNLKDTKIIPSEIIYIKSEEHYATIYSSSGTIQLIRNRLVRLEEQLRDFGFLRIHSRYLVNLNYLEDHHNQQIKLINNISLPISRNYMKRVNNALMDWIIKDEG